MEVDPMEEPMDDPEVTADGTAKPYVHRPLPCDSIVLPTMEEVLYDHCMYYQTPEYPVLPEKDTHDWQYVMRRTMQEVIPGLFLGPYAAATRAKLEDMKAAGITHVVCVREYLERNLIRPNHPEHFAYLVVEMADSCTEPLIPQLPRVLEFLDHGLAGKGKVLVHGNAGISRSAALVIAYVMAKFGVTLRQSFAYVQAKRFCCNPNEGFMGQLREWEPIYQANHMVPHPLPDDLPPKSSLKRSLEDDAPESASKW